MADLFCNQCGHRNDAGSNFCSSCGNVLDRATGEPATVTVHIDELLAEDDVAPRERSSAPTLIATRGPNAGSRFALTRASTTIGRHPDSDIFLDDVTVSRRHVVIDSAEDGHRLQDVGSLNGTYLNRRRIDSAELLQNGDEIQIGLFKLVFVTTGES